ncbi:hypothetical protein [Dyadobacter sp. CY323]|uniref:hypothetical protein n=1 Tax=Dyadobacter sp. CY323 TaxID=2907302 RepID=UPI001F38F823|nr:hypothetical protein [Dyadobacter sp. CY323]MCE6991906.1 hypothetical protein [Dyadobacter sp. CY323]
MNLDNLKTSWNALEEKIQASTALSEQVVLTMIRNQSQSTISRSQRKFKNLAFFFSGLLLLFVAIVSGNPFDYVRWYEFVPAVLYAIVIGIALKIIISENLEISRITLTKSNLRESLHKVIFIQERCQVAMLRIWKVSMVAGFLLGISLLVRHFEAYGLMKSVLIIAANALTIITMYLLAKNFFKQLPDVNLTNLKMYLKELDDLGA